MKQIYLNDFGVPNNNTAFLPYALGLLQVYAQTFSIINDNYQFMPMLFCRDTLKNIMSQYDCPDVAGFSVASWNYQLSLVVAQEIKHKFPNCLIVFGGPHVPLESQSFFEQYPFVDLTVYGEGEKIFKDILVQKLSNNILPHTTIKCSEPTKDLDIYPSPYVSKILDTIIKEYPNIQFKTIIETSRGCPFHCAYCFWGHSALIKKMGFHSTEYIKQDALWLAKNKIEYVFCADSNFGMFKQDVLTAQTYAEIKKEYSYPKKFRVCYGKNAEETIFQTASILHKAGLAKSVTLSLQSNNPVTLYNINRKNIKIETFKNLQQRYERAGMPTYTEVIHGLPGETYQSFIDGTEEILQNLKNNQLFIYICQILPNSQLADKEYREKFDIKSVIVPLLEAHYTIRPLDLVPEFMEILVGTNTMSALDWMKCVVLGWVVQIFHGFVGYDIIKWLVLKYNIKYMDIYTYIANSDCREILKIKEIAQNILKGIPWQQYESKYGEIYYEPDEIIALDIICDKENFYEKFNLLIKDFLNNNKLSYENSEIDNIIETQKQLLPNTNDYSNTVNMATDIILFGRKSKHTISK